MQCGYVLWDLPVHSTAHMLLTTLLQPCETHPGFFLSGKCWLGWILHCSIYMMMHNLGIRKIIWSLFHRVLPACPKMSVHGLDVHGLHLLLQTFMERWFITGRDFLGTFSCSCLLWSCGQGKGQSFLASSSLGSPWYVFGKIVQF